MTGLILCGGNSSRMGRDKGLLSNSGITWAETAYNKLAPYVSQVMISVNKQQQFGYSTHFPKDQLIIDNDQLTIGGPLRGLLSAHIQIPQEDIFLFACDLLYMENIVFKELINQQERLPDQEAYVFMQQQEAEPLCGIYASTGLAKILSSYRADTLGKQSMKHALETLNTLYLELPDEWQVYFRNVNTRHDLNS